MVRDFPAERVDFAEHHNAALARSYDALEHHLGAFVTAPDARRLTDLLERVAAARPQ